MYIQAGAAFASAANGIGAPIFDTSVGGDTSKTEKWSSFIGIVTAICGNILISFALNTQRYAHIRLSREANENHEALRLQRRRRRKGGQSYGTQQNAVAQQRAEVHAKSEPARDMGVVDESNETDPLIPSVDSLDTRKTSGDEDDSSGEEDEDAPKEKSYLKSPIWWLGITMMTLGEAGNFLAYGFAPASIVSPLGVVALISNCLIAPWLLHERFRWRDGLGVIIAVIGCVTVVMSASDSNPKLTPDSIWHLITRWEFETYLGITIALIIALSVASSRYGDRTILIDIGLVGLYGGYTALSTKGVASLLSNTIWRVVTFPITYLLVAVLVFTAVMQIKYVNRALQRFNSTMVIPTQFVMFTIFVIVGSAVLYRDFERTTTQDAAAFIGGCALTFLGVWAITSGRNDGPQEDEELGIDEDTINLLDEEGVQYEIRERDDDRDRRQSFIAGSSKASSRSGLPRIDLNETPIENQQPAEMTPANNAAIHDHTTSDLPPDSLHPADAIPKPPPMHATTSEPNVPTLDTTTLHQPRTPVRRGVSDYNHTPVKDAGTPRERHQHAETPDTQRLLNRRSVVGLLPGPLTSPLSSSLSAIVADSLRRGVDKLPAASLRRRSIKFRRKRNGDTDEADHAEADELTTRRGGSVADAPPLKRHSIASGTMDFGNDADDDETADLRATAGSPPGRLRSLSATLGDIFGSSSASRRQRINMNGREGEPST